MRGTYVYSDVQTMKVQGITVRTVGAVVGKVTLTIGDDGDATMDLTETVHSFFSTTSVGGRGEDQDAPLQTSTMIWSAGADCPVP